MCYSICVLFTGSMLRTWCLLWRKVVSIWQGHDLCTIFCLTYTQVFQYRGPSSGSSFQGLGCDRKKQGCSGKRSRKIEAMAANRYLLVSMPLQGSATSTWETLQQSIAKVAFDTPTYKVMVSSSMEDRCMDGLDFFLCMCVCVCACHDWIELVKQTGLDLSCLGNECHASWPGYYFYYVCAMAEAVWKTD